MRSIAATAFLLFVLLAILLMPAAQVAAQTPMPPGPPTNTSVDAVLTLAMTEIRGVPPTWADDFSTNSDAWRLHQDLGAGDSVAIGGGALTVQGATPGRTVGAYWSTHNLNNALIQVSAGAVGDAPAFSGLIFHRQDEQNFHFLSLTNATPSLYKQVGGTWQAVAPQLELPNRSVAPAVSNRIAVLALSPTIGVMVNGQLRAWYRDESFTHGTAGVMIGLANDDPSATVEFDDFKVWSLTQGYADQLRSRLPGGGAIVVGPPTPLPLPTPTPVVGPPTPLPLPTPTMSPPTPRPLPTSTPPLPGPTPTLSEADIYRYDEGSPAMREKGHRDIEDIIELALAMGDLTWLPWFTDRGLEEPLAHLVLLRPNQLLVSQCTQPDPLDPDQDVPFIAAGRVPNAFYCPADRVTVDGVETNGFLIFATEYLTRVLLGETVGGRDFEFNSWLPIAIALHEYSHHIQDELYRQLRADGVRIAEPQGSTIELIADCLAASNFSFLNFKLDYGLTTPEEDQYRAFVAEMIEGMAVLGDITDLGHGTNAQREAAFRLGYETEAGYRGGTWSEMVCFETYWPEVVPHIPPISE